MITYLELVVSAFLFSVQFVFQKRFDRTEGETLRTAFLFSFLTSVVRVLFLLCLGGFRVASPTPVVLLLTLLSMLNGVFFLFMSAKAFGYADMSLFSLLAMLGGMVLPFLYGIAFCGEGLGLVKCACFLLIAFAILLGVRKTSGKGALKYYIGVFLSNGMSGVIATMNREAAGGVDGNSFLIIAGLWSVIGSGAILLLGSRKKKEGEEKTKLFVSPKSALPSAVLYGLSCSLGNLLLMIALTSLPASVQYPFITGGTIAFSALIALARREKVSSRSLFAAGIAIAASVLLVFA